MTADWLCRLHVQFFLKELLPGSPMPLLRHLRLRRYGISIDDQSVPPVLTHGAMQPYFHSWSSLFFACSFPVFFTFPSGCFIFSHTFSLQPLPAHLISRTAPVCRYVALNPHLQGSLQELRFGYCTDISSVVSQNVHACGVTK